MGISDEAYAKELEKLKTEAGQIVATTHLNNALNSATITAHPYNTKIGEPKMVASDLDHEAAKVSIDTLRDMWVIRWQDNWVKTSDVADDDFWRIAFVRLENVNKLERHMLFDRMEYVYRIIE